MGIQIPWELFLNEAENNRKRVKRSILATCRSWPTHDYVRRLQNNLNLLKDLKKKLRSFKTGDNLKKLATKRRIATAQETNDKFRKKLLPNIRDKFRKNRKGFELKPKVSYPNGRRIIFIKPGKEAYDVKDNGKFEIYNPDDMLPLILKNNSEIKLSTQSNIDATMGELARELAKIKRFNKNIFGEICAILIRMSMYYENDHERLDDGSYAWSPDTIMRKRILELNDEINKSKEPIDLWNFLLVCQAISIQEDVKYNEDFCKRRGIKTPKIGRYTHLTSMVLWGDILGSVSDVDMVFHASKFDTVLTYNSVITLSLKEIKELFKDYLSECSKETEILLILESIKQMELKQYCKDRGLKVGGKVSELIQRLFPYYFQESKTITELKKHCKQRGLKVSKKKYELIQEAILFSTQESKTITELKEDCKQRGLKADGTEAELIQRLLPYLRLESKTVAQLKELCKTKKMGISGSKMVLIQKLI